MLHPTQELEPPANPARFTGLFIATESWLNASAPPQMRGGVFAVYMVATYATFGAGQFMLGLAPADHFDLYAIASGLLCLALVLVSTTRSATPVLPESPKLRLRELRHLAPVSIGGCIVAGVVSSAFFALVPAMAASAGFPTGSISKIVAAAIFGGLAFQIPVGWLSDRLDRRLVAAGLSFGLALCAVACLSIDPVGSTLSVAEFARVFLLGGFFSTIYPVCVSHANDRVDRDRVVAVSGQLILIYGLGSCLGPIVGAWVVGRGGMDAFFWFLAASAAVFCIVAIIRCLSRERPRNRRPGRVLAGANVTPAGPQEPTT